MKHTGFACCSPRPSVGAPAAAPRHPAGGTATHRVERFDWRGASTLFPRISLTGLFGFASGSLGGLFSGSARTWSFTGDVAGPIYTGGGLTAAVDQAEARHDQQLASYELVIQNAFRDVDDLLADMKYNAELRDIARPASARLSEASS